MECSSPVVSDTLFITLTLDFTISLVDHILVMYDDWNFNGIFHQ